MKLYGLAHSFFHNSKFRKRAHKIIPAVILNLDSDSPKEKKKGGDTQFMHLYLLISPKDGCS